MRRHAKASSAGSSKRKAPAARLTVLSVLVLAALVAFATSGALAKPQVTENYASFGPDGTESSDFEWIGGVAYDQQSGIVYVLDAEAGTLSKFEADGTPLPFTGTAPYISAGVITGLAPNVELNVAQVAVDSASHLVYVTEETSIRAFQPDGEAAKFSAGPGAGTNEIGGFGKTTGVAVDANGAIYASDETAETVSIYEASGAPITTFAVNPGNLAVAPGGAVYVDRRGALPNFEAAVRKFTPNEFPVTPTTTYTASTPLEPTSASYYAVGVGVDPANGDVYVLETNNGDAWIKVFDKAGNFVRFIAEPAEGSEGGHFDGHLGGHSQGVAVVGGGEEIQLYAGDSKLFVEHPHSKVAIFGEEIIEGPPAIVSTSASDVTSGSSTLRATVNPNTAATSYRFEYGLEDCAVSACASAPVPDGQVPAGHLPVALSEAIFGLAPGTTYHYRIVAENSFDATAGPDRTFTTQVSGLGFQLPDARAWEMVTPSDKHGAKLGKVVDGATQAAAGGDGFAYVASASIEADPESSRSLEAASAIARRGAAGWQSKDITPPHENVSGLALAEKGEYKLYSSDLARVVLAPRTATLFSPQASERTPYIRENTEPPTYTPLVTGKEGFANVPPGTEFGGDPTASAGPLKFGGASADLSHVVISSEIPLAAAAGGAGLYEWVADQLHPVSALPASEGGAIVYSTSIGTDRDIVRDAISADGSRVFWTSNASTRHLYMRDTVAEETVRLDAVAGGSGLGNAAPVYQGASSDGSVAFFTDSQQLTADASPEGRDLYRCELPPGAMPTECATLTDLSAPLGGSGESAEVQGIASGLSEDGTKVYFVAKGVLDTAPNAFDDVAVAKQPNLYLWQEGEGVRFLATLSKDDSQAWGKEASENSLSAFVSPSGRYLTFMSERSLSGYDNTEVASDKPAEEVFRYDAVADELTCISCNPSGALPRGERVDEGGLDGHDLIDPAGIWNGRLLAANLPHGPTAAESHFTFYQPRVAADSGRVFFHSYDALVPGDSNGNWDVYEYEPTGVGGCTASSGSASTARSGDGCVSLVSSGTGEGESVFLDASETGDDVFFTSTQRLSVLDTDEERDIYDARVNGVVAKLTPRTECQGEACLPAPQAPNDPTPASASFRGAGNLAERCPAGRRRATRNGVSRCVAHKHKKHRRHHKAGKANPNRRAGR